MSDDFDPYEGVKGHWGFDEEGRWGFTRESPYESATCLNGPVRIGERVRVVKGERCCGYSKWIGDEFVVSWIERQETTCPRCRRSMATVMLTGPGAGYYDPRTVHRLDPDPNAEPVAPPKRRWMPQ